jgi:hypothetical protein
MKKLGLACAATVMTLSFQLSCYADGGRATTTEVPAALKALQPSQAKMLTKSQASRIRGEGYKNPAGNFYGYKPGGGFKNPAGKFKGYKPGR